MIKMIQTETYRKWEEKLRDGRARKIITARLFRLADGLSGNISPVGDGISELKIHYGPGDRVYFQQRGNVLIILLCGGDKSTKDEDIQRAKDIAKELEVD
jgi:putative addiction module killer protein